MITRWHQIGDLFNDAIDVPLSERDRSACRRCRGDAELQSEVESLSRPAKADGYMAGAVRSAVDSMVNEATPADGPPLWVLPYRQ